MTWLFMIPVILMFSINLNQYVYYKEKSLDILTITMHYVSY